MTEVEYYMPEYEDDYSHPNVFTLQKPSSECSVGDIIKVFS